MSPELNEKLRELPSVDEVMHRLDARCPRELLANETRRIIEQVRERMRRGEYIEVGTIPARVLEALETLERPSLRRVINATGVVLHTNLGRAPLPAAPPVDGYSNLEYDLDTGKRGKRDIHVSTLLERLTGKPGIVVNNNAAAVWLALNELAAGHEVLVSRGELIEIGDGFRIPDIMTRSGVILREVGTTNRTRIDDYRHAITDRTKVLMRVHASNFRMSGFTSTPPISELVSLAHERDLTVYEDLGSGCLVDLRPWGVDEPSVGESIEAGVDLVSFSGDKLLGGPQAGLLAGDEELIKQLRRNPMFRAFRVDKLIYSALEATLRHTLFCHWERVPTLHMIALPANQIRNRAEELAGQMDGLQAEVLPGLSIIGGGTTPEQALPTFLIALQAPDVNELEERLRTGEPAVIARIEDDRLILDLRTVFPEEEDELLNALRRARDTSLPTC